MSDLPRRALQDLAVEVRVELRAAALELAELLPPALLHERCGEAQPGRPAAGARVHRVDRLLWQIERELAAEELDRLGTRERELGCGDVEDGPGKTPARKSAELRRSARCQNKMSVVR